MPYSSAEAAVILNRYRGTQPSSMAQTYLAIFTTLPDNTGSGGTEAAYSGYARVRIDNVMGSPSAKQMANTSAITFATCTTNTGLKARGWGLYDASSGGNLLMWQPYTNEQRTFTGAATGDTFTCPGHSYNDGDIVRFFDADESTLPSGVVEGTSYYVVNSNTGAGTFKVSATEGGAAIDLTVNGNGLVVRITEQALNNNVTIQFGVGAFIVRFF